MNPIVEGSIVVLQSFTKWINESQVLNLDSQSLKKNSTSEDDQVLECEIHQTKYKVMIGYDMDWPP